ncbi:hypothetical protein S40285_02401 [Stachybotrys chlorohalonatus IBT 40285]|uniref:RRM domain-containing protein n=1 Tax=Stachybotrys chlorohalonatus (strain IBT 40285) TaxID=1283841 RepID=A0A084QPM6_STAC4|nr:hypothetical protein S40285_02401 [Stachybotrys chlorohalonata IBT 40285]
MNWLSHAPPRRSVQCSQNQNPIAGQVPTPGAFCMNPSTTGCMTPSLYGSPSRVASQMLQPSAFDQQWADLRRSRHTSCSPLSENDFLNHKVHGTSAWLEQQTSSSQNNGSTGSERYASPALYTLSDDIETRWKGVVQVQEGSIAAAPRALNSAAQSLDVVLTQSLDHQRDVNMMATGQLARRVWQESRIPERFRAPLNNLSQSAMKPQDTEVTQTYARSPGTGLQQPSRPQPFDHPNMGHPQHHTPSSRPEDPTSPQRRGFHPMQAIYQEGLFRQHMAPQPSVIQDSVGTAFQFSNQYHGMHTESNASAENLPPEQNCGLWLTNLPPSVDVHELLGSIKNVGRVWCTYVNVADNFKHHTAAAKIVFFTPDAARRLLTLSWTRGLYVGDYRARVSHNRIKTGEHPTAGKMSRVLIITGSSDFVNDKNLTEYFRERFVFELDEVTELIRAGHRCVLEYKFGSYRCQAQMGKMALEKDRPCGFEKVEYGDDPCEVGDTLSAYGIAAERIQGKGM